MAMINGMQENMDAVLELREWAFQQWRNVEVREGMEKLEMGMAAGELMAFAMVVAKADEMMERGR